MSQGALKISVVASALTADPHHVARMARTMGFAGVQLDAGWPGLEISAFSPSGRRELQRLCASESQQLVGLGADIGPRGLGPGADIDRALDRLRQLMEAAAGLAAPLVCVDIGPLPSAVPPPRPKTPIMGDLAGSILIPAAPVAAPAQSAQDSADADHVALVQSALAELGRRADRFSVTVALRSELSSPGALEAALRLANCPWFGVDFDPTAILPDDGTLDQTLSAVGRQIRHVRARDALRGTENRTRPAPIGTGSTDWPRLLADLDSAAYHGWFTIDPTGLPDRSSAAAAGLLALRSIARR